MEKVHGGAEQVGRPRRGKDDRYEMRILKGEGGRVAVLRLDAA